MPTEAGSGGGMDGTLLRRSFIDFVMRIQYFLHSMGRTHWLIAAGVVFFAAQQPREAHAQVHDQGPPRSTLAFPHSPQSLDQIQNQSKSSLTPGTSRDRTVDCNPVFTSVEQGLVSGSPEVFAQHLATRLYVSLPEEQGGSFSADQVYYLLDGFLRNNALSGFRFTTVDSSGTTPYATGGTSLSVKGAERQAQVYVSLSYVAERWVITKINIY
ncbi:MAG: DUF4783 domain-containing protein [Bacteroidota bacterium]